MLDNIRVTAPNFIIKHAQITTNNFPALHMVFHFMDGENMRVCVSRNEFARMRLRESLRILIIFAPIWSAEQARFSV